MESRSQEHREDSSSKAATLQLTTRENLVRIARYQRWVMIAFLANVPANILGIIAYTQPVLIAIPMFTVSIAVTIYVIASVFLLSRYAFSVDAGVLCSILMVVPCVSLIVLLIINQKATAVLQQQGVHVGFLGADPTSIYQTTSDGTRKNP